MTAIARAMDRLARPLEVFAAAVVALVGTALALVVIGVLNRAPPPPEAQDRPALVAIPVAPRPPELEPDPAPEPEAPSTSVAPAATDPPPAPTLDASALPPPDPSGLAPGGIGVLPALSSGLPTGLGTTAPPSSEAPPAPITPARPLARPAPRYPRDAQRRGIEGHVTVRLRVNPRGRVTDVVVVDATPPGIFDEVAKQTARRYRFEPATQAGQPVATTIEQRIVFRLQR